MTAALPARTAAENVAADELAARMTELGMDLAVTVREVGPAAVGEWLDANVSILDAGELRALLVMLAAMVDVDRPARELLGWTSAFVTWPGERRVKHACGTEEAFQAHAWRNKQRRQAGLPCDLIDPVCREAHDVRVSAARQVTGHRAERERRAAA
jgi:hypothetical protein